MKETVIVGLSGGVDSSFAAAILKQQGFDVVGVMLKLWSVPEQEELNRCCSLDAMVLAKRVAAILDIPFYAIDAREIFRQTVVEYFMKGYGSGFTPNPCVLCNAEVRWKVLLEQAHKMGADKISTGHYARVEASDGQYILKPGLDQKKDQSYVLSMLPSEYLRHTILPVGTYLKPDVRERCKQFGLPTASRPDSQDLCFLGNMDYREFLTKYTSVTETHGEIVDQTGKIIGQHSGLHKYTIGQRKGLRVANKDPLYVIRKDFDRNQIITGLKSDLDKDQFSIRSINWLVEPQGNEIYDVNIKVRYSSPMIAGKMWLKKEGIWEVKLEKSSTEISPGQVAAVYKNEICYGGGIIV